MTLLNCFECEYSAATVPGLEGHLWAAHRPETTHGETICPTCNTPVKKDTFSYHFPCLFDVSSIEFFTEPDGCLCPLCGKHFQTERALDRHCSSHPRLEILEFLGETQMCRQCGGKISPGQLEDHYGCLLAVTVGGDSTVEAGQYACPKLSCDSFFDSKGTALWHLWLKHLGREGLSGPCSGCGENVEFGEIQAHLACLDDRSPAETTALLPESEKTCLVCGLSVYSSDVLQRHYNQKHISSRRRCPKCGERFTNIENTDALNHIVCLAASDGSGRIDGVDEAWHCPECATTSTSKQAFNKHLSDSHTSLITGSPQCGVCGEAINAIAPHKDCLLTGSQVTNRTGDIRSPSETHDTIESNGSTNYFTELNEFVSLEIDAKREEAWTRYRDRSIESLARSNKAIPELLHVGVQHHSEYEHQLVYQHADTKGSSSHDIDLVEEYGIYPGNHVIIGAPASEELPREAVVTYVEEQSIWVALRSEDGVVTDSLLQELSQDDRVYHCAQLLNPRPFEREQEAIKQVQNDPRLRKIVLGDSSVSEQPVVLPDSASGDLNEYQKQAVERALGADDILCIHGPPGTGKTRTLTRLIRLAIARGERVLATSHSNQAIDNLLVGSSSVTTPDQDSLHYVASPAGDDRTLPYELQTEQDKNPDNKEIQRKVAALLGRPDELTISRVGENTDSDVVQREYTNRSTDKADLVAGTMSSLAELDADSEFDLVVIDEAGQATQPASFIPLLRGNRVVFAGDHLQLPPYAADESAKEEEMHISLFEHILNTFDSSISVMLQRQYRMNEEIASFPSAQIYDGNLSTAEQNRKWTIEDLKPLMAVDVQGKEQTRKNGYSKYNPTEAEIVADHVKLLQMYDVPLEDIGVITPYSAQIREVKKAVSEKIGTTHNLKVATVDSFQGSEREAIIVSFVRSNTGQHSGFLALPDEGKRRLNVSLTRAKKRLVLIGDWNTLGTAADYEQSDTCSNLYSALYHELNERDLTKKL